MRDGSKTRAKIEAEALRLFVERSVAETSMRDIAAAVGVVEGALYRHFAGKDALVEHLFSASYLGFAEKLEQQAAGASDPRSELGRMIAAFCAFFDEDPLRFRFLLLVQHGQLEKLPSGVETPFDVIRKFVASAVRAKAIPKQDLDLATAMLMGLVLQVATSTIYGRLSRNLSRHASKLTSSAWAVLSSSNGREK
jgi:AcrR family transcriptional regulator